MKIRQAALLLAALLLLPGCGQRQAAAEAPVEAERPAEEAEEMLEYAKGAELIATAHTQEDADLIAELYGITLVRWTGHIAVYHTEEDPHVVIGRRQDGWPALELNRIVTLTDPVERPNKLGRPGFGRKRSF